MSNLLYYLFRQNLARKSFSIHILQSLTILIALYIMSPEIKQVSKSLPSLILLLTIISTFSSIDNLYKKDSKLGILDFYTTSYEIKTIILAQFLNLFILSIICLYTTTIISYIIFQIPIKLAFMIIIASSLALVASCVIFSVMGAISLYFENHSTIISSIIIPFIFPSLIVYSLFIQTFEIKFLFISVAINCILMPTGLLLTKILLEN